ncbi:MAG: hypothetical protein HUJ53_01420 [Holdemanella sp.]|nr:hypothetical protein [Holdemanella sp.]
MNKLFKREATFGCGMTGTEYIEAYEENGKFYLKIHKVSCHIVGHKQGKGYEVWNDRPFIKEFRTKEQANNYFKAINKNHDWKAV